MLDEPGMQDTAGEAHTWYGRAKAGRPARTYSSYVRIRDVALKTCQRRWTIGRSDEKGSGISVLAVRLDDDDDDDIVKTRMLIEKKVKEINRRYSNVFVVGNEIQILDESEFHFALRPLGNVWIYVFFFQFYLNSRADLVLSPWLAEEKF